MDYCRNSSNIMAARVIRWENKSKTPKHRQLDSYSDRYRRHPHHIEPAWGDINLSSNRRASVFLSGVHLLFIQASEAQKPDMPFRNISATIMTFAI